MAYEKQFRQRVLSYMAEGHTQRATAELFGISTTTLKTWRRLIKTGEGLEINPRRRKPFKIDPEKLRAYVSSNPDAYVREIASEFGCVPSAIDKALKKLGITRKKRR